MKIALYLSPLLLVFFTSNAQDRYFARTYTSNVLPKGAIDLEFSHTSRMGHEGQYFHAQDQRIEVEWGLGGRLQTAFYFNRYQKRFSTGTEGTVSENEIGFSNEWKWKVSKPFAKTGIALYGEWGLKGGDELELESKLILDRTIGKNLIAFNAVAEYEREFEWIGNRSQPGSWSLPVEFDLGYMYQVLSSLGVGFEIRNHNEIVRTGGWEHSVFFGGPTVDIRGNDWFIIANYLPQWGNVHHTAVSPNNKVLDNLERVEARIIFGVSIK